MKLIYAKRNKDIATFYVYGAVGSEVNGNDIAEDINYINQYYSEEVKEIHIKINSEGGNVINGMSAISAILNSTIPVKTFNDGYAMSMAGLFWLAAKKENRYSAEFAILMLHAPYLANEDGSMAEVEDESERDFITAVSNQLKTIIKSTTDKTDSEINEIFSKDSFYNANEMMMNGFITPDNIVKFQNKPKLTNDIKANIKTIAAFYNVTNINTNKMEFTIQNFKEMLGLAKEIQGEGKDVKNYGELKTKYDAVIEDKKTLTARAEKAEAENKKLQNELEGLEGLKAELAKKEATNKVETAIKDGKIKEDAKDEMIVLALESPKAFDSVVGSIVVNHKAPELPEPQNNLNEVAKEFGIDGEFTVHSAFRAGKLEAIKAKYPAVYTELMKMEGAE